ncbi:archaeal serine protease [Candidatus Nitrososphaera evergladensis SR1]|uniref:Archaeal serine protease n=1 Tax=Candidatus Nitrososphaera evergladensis SR1 TaxID=1459636 RepID=A0A075MPD3_9ARCH|nr:sialidase family protein [Candidatus Nitrososphaera evergladensis]AIF82652.1 archaeal serine protease [Candidatus Nitrososphaera evergladensis SR1]
MAFLIIITSFLAIFQYAFMTPVAASTQSNLTAASPALLAQEREGMFVSADQPSTSHHQTIAQKQQPPGISDGNNTGTSSGNASSSLLLSSPSSQAQSQSIPFLAVISDQATGTVFPGSGQVLKLMIDVREGRGDILVNTNIFSGGMWQNSARTAASVAQSLTQEDLSSKDVVLTIKSTNSTESEEMLRKFGGGVDGPSAGGAMTVLLVSELEGKAVNNYTAMTGTINPDGTIGPVGGIIEKAVAAGRYGAKVMLVPAGQSYYPEVSCQQQHPESSSSSSFDTPAKSNTCRLEEKSLSYVMEKQYGMKVIEVHDVRSALSYFQSDGGNGTTTTVQRSLQQQREEEKGLMPATIVSSNKNNSNDDDSILNLSNDDGFSSFFLTAEDVSSNAMMAASGNNVYAIWVDNSTGSLGSFDIFFARSTNGGDSFDRAVDLSAPIRNNGSIYGNSYSPQIAASGSSVYVTWIENVYAASQDRQDSHILFSKSDDGGRTFQGPFDISGGTSGIPEPESLSLAYPLYSSNPQIIAASGSNGEEGGGAAAAYVVWTVHPLIVPTAGAQQQQQQGRVGEGDIFFTRIGPDGSLLAEPVNLSNNTGESHSPRIGLSGSNVYVAWADDTRGDGEIFFRHISDNGLTLGPVVNISNNYLQDDKPQIATGVDGNNSSVYVIWQHSGRNETGATTGAIGFASSQDNGTTFSKPTSVMTTRIDPAIGPLHHLAITTTATTAGRNLDQQGNSNNNTDGRGNASSSNNSAYIVWSDGTIGNRNIYFSKSNATDNNNPFPYYYWTLSNNTGESILPEIAVSGSGNVYVVWMDDASGAYDIYFREANFTSATSNNDFEVTFSDTINISNTTAGNSVFPQIIAEGDNVYIAWEEHVISNNGSNNNGSAVDNVNSEIYFKKLER